jgi:hypothetical protein
MAQTSNKTYVVGRGEVLNTLIKKEVGWWIFKVSYYETALTEHIGNDLHITADREIREVYLNGKPLLNNQ